MWSNPVSFFTKSLQNDGQNAGLRLEQVGRSESIGNNNISRSSEFGAILSKFKNMEARIVFVVMIDECYADVKFWADTHGYEYYTIPYYTILYYTILYYTILYYTILYYTILYYTILYYTLQSTSSYFLLMNILGYVHTGMYTGALGILDGYGMRGYLLDLAARGYDIRIVGHSLGAGNCS